MRIMGADWDASLSPSLSPLLLPLLPLSLSPSLSDEPPLLARVASIARVVGPELSCMTIWASTADDPGLLELYAQRISVTLALDDEGIVNVNCELLELANVMDCCMVAF